ncbi:MAG TPA: FtsX-like permease family protein [Phenylobacterium sp.]|jgi:putative ABC transport system permease protein|uniref:ABC transporter permease n=1 Tax=Phenylobacterium sp. TaxID=1871053 RepID=UPI002CFE27BD|nr:FtsX-like permease family protein [Phenylobacterium sp.]HXA39770.1 FtsX-like permease family protein [Phenylobacterium sp.]
MTPLSFRFAGRELRGGVRGFRIFLACLALGVAAIAAAGSTAEAFRRGLASQAGEILGGDLALTVRQRGFNPAEQAILGHAGQVSYSVASMAMAQSPSGDRRLIELRGVNSSYPLAGKVTLTGAPSLQAAIAPVGGVAGAVVEQSLLDKLHMQVGDRFLAGNLPLVVRGVLLQEPDRLSRGFALGPRVITNLAAVQQGGFMAPGLPFGVTARVELPPGAPLAPAKADLHRRLGGLVRIRDRDDAAPGIHRLIDQLEYFLGFIGLASLVAGGLGVFGAVSAYLEARKPVIATLKALGAEGQLVRDIYLIQIGFLAALGVAIGLAFGAAAPLVMGAIIKNSLPIPALFAVYPAPLAKAAAFGLLSAAAFSLAPLGRARSTPPASLFRSDLSGTFKIGPEIVGAVLAAAGLAAMAVVTAPTPLAAGIMIAGVAVSFGLLWALGWGSAVLAGKARAGARGPLRIGLANLAGPHSAARTASPAIGLGVALLAAVVLIQSALLNQVAEVAPRTAPALVFTDIPGDRPAEFDAAVRRAFGVPLTSKNYLREPFVSGRITQVRGQPVDLAKIARSDRWAYDSDISMSAIGPEPEGAGIEDGHWWAASYAGPAQVAMDVDVARGEKIKVGDAVTLSVLGRDIDAKVAVLRKVDFGGFGASFPLVVTPSAMEGANLRQVAIAKASKAQEAAVIRELGRSFPTVNVISVREQLEAATDLFDRLALAVRGAAAVAALAGLLVLAGAIAARARARTREAATLKVLGASRGQILGAYVLEYGAVGVIAGAAGVALGYAAAWPVVVKVFHAKWSMDWAGVAALLAAAALVAGVGGLLAAFQALSKRPAPALRAE